MTEEMMQEFWKGLNRLYDDTVKQAELCSQLRVSCEELRVSCDDLREIATKHESRLDKLEVVQQWLAEAERKREKEKGK